MFIVDSFDPVDLVAPVALFDSFDLFDSYSHPCFHQKQKAPTHF